MAAKPENRGQTVDLGSLSAQQLMQVKKQLDDELEHLNDSFNKLRIARSKFNECLGSIEKGVVSASQGKEILVPLTTSLYVPGKIASTDKVIVDIGTGFYIEKNSREASSFYQDKVKELEGNLKDLESILQGKAGNLRVVEAVLRQKVLQSPNSTPQSVI